MNYKSLIAFLGLFCIASISFAGASQVSTGNVDTYNLIGTFKTDVIIPMVYKVDAGTFDNITNGAEYNIVPLYLTKSSTVRFQTFDNKKYCNLVISVDANKNVIITELPNTTASCKAVPNKGSIAAGSNFHPAIIFTAKK